MRPRADRCRRHPTLVVQADEGASERPSRSRSHCTGRNYPIAPHRFRGPLEDNALRVASQTGAARGRGADPAGVFAGNRGLCFACVVLWLVGGSGAIVMTSNNGIELTALRAAAHTGR